MLLTDPGLSTRMGAKARSKALQYSWSRASERTSLLYRETAWSGHDWAGSPEAVRMVDELAGLLGPPFHDIIDSLFGKETGP